jgi:hypothetical protein
MLPRAPVVSPARRAVMVATSTSAWPPAPPAGPGALRNRAQGPDDLISRPHRDGMHPGKSHLECGGAEPRPVVVSGCDATGRRMSFPSLSRIGVVRCGAVRRRLSAGGPFAGGNRHRAGRASARPARQARLLWSPLGRPPPTRCDPSGSRHGRACRRPVAGHRRWRAVIAGWAGGAPADTAEGGGVHDVTASVSGCCPAWPCGWPWHLQFLPDT